MKIIFLGASNFSVPFLNCLQNSRHQVRLVITNPDKKKGRGKKKLANPVKKKALELGLEIIETSSIDSQAGKIKGLDFDLTLVVSFGKILPEEFLKIKPGKNINVHPSLLPKYRGPTPITSALINGEEVSGVTIMEVTGKLDAGPIYTQAKFRVGRDENKDRLEEKIIHIGCPLLLPTLDMLEEEKIKPFPQKGRATYTKTVTKDDLKINWEEDALKIYNKIRAFSYKPGCFTFLGKKRIKILEAGMAPIKTDRGLGGTVLEAEKSKGIFVSCGDGRSLSIKVLQPAGKNMIGYKDFLNGYPIEAGDRFG